MKNTLTLLIAASAASLLLSSCYTVLDIQPTPPQTYESYIPAPPSPIIIIQPVYEPVYLPPGSSAPTPIAPEVHRPSGNQRSDEQGSNGAETHRTSGSRRD